MERPVHSPEEEEPQSLLRFCARAPKEGPSCTPPVVIRFFGFSVITFVPRYLYAGDCAFPFVSYTQSRSRLGLVVRCGDLARSQKSPCLFVRFFTYSQKCQKRAPFSLIAKVCGHV